MIARRPRPAFTLLEMILSLSIGLVLLWGLFLVLSTQLSQSQAGRESIQEATLARAILARIGNDVSGCLGPYNPHLQAEAASSEETTETMPADSSGSIVFNVGVQGDGSQLVLTVNRVPRELLGSDKTRTDASAAKVSDLRRITYWIVEGKGLAHQEVKRVTGVNAENATAESDQPIKYIAEVKSITFQFWDGTDWTSSWDSSSPGADGDTPIGPPAGIEIVIELGDNKYRHVVNVPTGNNYSTQSTP